MDYVRELGALVLDHRFRRMTEALLGAQEELYAAEGLSFRPRWTSTFRLLHEQGPLAIMEVAERLRLTHPAVIAIAGDMISAGLVADVRDRADGRRRLVTLTPEGRSLAPRLYELQDALAAAQRERFAAAGCDIVPVLDRVDDGLAERSLAAEVRARLGTAGTPGASPAPRAT
ncbi:MAG TPA: MarR family transcriptional regulator, partial [Longimicrobiaceae bacterium]|nr:MarR family transcriptional regulator [Longimicrobiaceae bacterium]